MFRQCDIPVCPCTLSIHRNVMSIHVICGQVENHADGHYTYDMEITQEDITYIKITLKDITCMEITQKDITCMGITDVIVVGLKITQMDITHMEITKKDIEYSEIAL